MKRAALAVLSLLLLAGAALPADASCAADVGAAQQHLAHAKNPPHRRELELLLDKAANDAAAGREQLCRDDMVRTQALYP